MKTITGIVAGLVLLGLIGLCGIAAAQEDMVLTDDIAPYSGPIGADSPLYGLKLALENVDESFTANETERLDKEMEHAQLRLSEVRRSLELNESDSAQQALDNYWLKMNLTNITISRWNSNTTGLLHAQEMIVKHQYVLEYLLETHPNSTGLARAYNNSLLLEEKFGEKTAIEFNRTIDKNNQTILRAIKLEQKVHDRKGWPDANGTINQTQSDDKKQNGGDKDKGREKGSGNVTQVTTGTPPIPSVTPTGTGVHQQTDGQGQGSQQDNKQNGNGGNKGQGNFRGK